MQRVKVMPLFGTAAPGVIHVGTWAARIPYSLDPYANLLYLPEAVLAETGMRPGQQVHALVRDRGAHVHVGPLVGVLLGPNGMALLHGAAAQGYREHLREARAEGTIPFFFELSGVNRQIDRVRCWADREGRWESVSLPLPDIVYNRATYRSPDQRATAHALRRQLVALDGVTLLNGANSFSKWEVHAALRFFADTAELTPETTLFSDPAALTGMLGRYPKVFLKADHGSHGGDVLRLSSGPDGISIRGFAGDGPVEETFADGETLLRFLDLLRGHQPWVIQQGIDLLAVEGRVFDLRVLVQKDGFNEWQAPLALIRLAPPEQIATNMSRGGEPFSPATFLQRWGNQLPEIHDMEAKLKSVAVRVATALEARFGLLGEVGVDVGLDRTGRPWVFEANTKPLHPQISWLQDTLMHYPFAYAVYLAGRGWAGQYAGLPRPLTLG